MQRVGLYIVIAWVTCASILLCVLGRWAWVTDQRVQGAGAEPPWRLGSRPDPTGNGFVTTVGGELAAAGRNIGAADLDAALASPPCVGCSVANSVAATSLSVDAGVTTCASSNAPVQDTCGWSAITTAGWTLVDQQVAPPANTYQTWNTKVTLGETTTGGNVTFTAFTLVDGGTYLVPQGGAATPTKVASLSVVSGTGCAGCVYGTGCTCGNTTGLFTYEAIVDGGYIQLQVEQATYDASSNYYARASVDTPVLLP
jgi:hypothetical protein